MGTEPRAMGERFSEQEPPDFESLFKFYYRPLVGFFCNRGFSAQEGEDLAQETFANAYRGYGDFRGDSSALTWLYSIAHNVLRNELRHRGRQKREIEPVSLDVLREERPDQAEAAAEAVEDDALTRIVSGQERRMLAAALEELPRRRRQVLHLRIVQDLKFREIAGLLQIDVNTAKSHFSQAKSQLRSMLGGGSGKGDGKGKELES